MAQQPAGGADTSRPLAGPIAPPDAHPPLCRVLKRALLRCIRKERMGVAQRGERPSGVKNRVRHAASPSKESKSGWAGRPTGKGTGSQRAAHRRHNLVVVQRGHSLCSATRQAGSQPSQARRGPASSLHKLFAGQRLQVALCILSRHSGVVLSEHLGRVVVVACAADQGGRGGGESSGGRASSRRDEWRDARQRGSIAGHHTSGCSHANLR